MYGVSVPVMFPAVLVVRGMQRPVRTFFLRKGGKSETVVGAWKVVPSGPEVRHLGECRVMGAEGAEDSGCVQFLR
jgi:hypothetical protein